MLRMKVVPPEWVIPRTLFIAGIKAYFTGWQRTPAQDILTSLACMMYRAVQIAIFGRGARQYAGTPGLKLRYPGTGQCIISRVFSMSALS